MSSLKTGLFKERIFLFLNLEAKMRQTSTVKRTTVKTRSPKNRLESSLPQTTSNTADFYQKVQEVAYQLYVARGCAHGYDVEDWAKAEEIVRGA
jgi:hypothetical protein